MKAKKAKPVKSLYFLATERCADVYKQAYTENRLRSCRPLAREHRGTFGAVTMSDWKADFEIIVKKSFKHSESRRAFWQWVFSPEKVGEDGKSRKIGTEMWQGKVGAALCDNGLYPVSEYFRPVCRASSTDKSKIIIDRPRMMEITKKYEHLRTQWEVHHAEELLRNEQELAQTDIETDIETDMAEPVSSVDTPDCVDLCGEPVWQEQPEVLDYEQVNS